MFVMMFFPAVAIAFAMTVVITATAALFFHKAVVFFKHFVKQLVVFDRHKQILAVFICFEFEDNYFTFINVGKFFCRFKKYIPVVFVFYLSNVL